MKKNGLFIGLTTIDIQYFVDSFPDSNVKIKTLPPEITVGGPATNAAVAFAHLNGNARLISAIGENPFKNYIFDDLDQHKVETFDVAEEQEVSPVIASVITSKETGDRNIFTHFPSPISNLEKFSSFLKNSYAEFLLIDGFYPEIAILAVQQAKQNNIPVIADCGSWKEQYDELLPYVDYAICSNDFYPPKTNNSIEVFDYLASKNIKYRAITRGGESILWNSGNQVKEINTPKVNVVDTLGAGDFFHGAFCFYISKINNFEQALEAASVIASQSCAYPGTRKWLKYIKQDSKLKKSSKLMFER